MQYKSFENTVGKGEIARNEQFLLFLQCFLPHFENFLPFPPNSKLSPANSFSLEESKCCFYPFWELSAIFAILKIVVCKFFQFRRVQNLLFGKGLNPFPNNKTWFLRVCCTSLLKTQWEKKKLLVTSNSLFQQCFIPIFRTFCHFCHFEKCRLQTLSVSTSLKFVVWERVLKKIS